jgi:hypothetical protein
MLLSSFTASDDSEYCHHAQKSKKLIEAVYFLLESNRSEGYIYIYIYRFGIGREREKERRN